MTVPDSSRFVIVGAGIHGLSTAVHLARELRAGPGPHAAEITVIDKQEVGAGASGIACGVIRNNYFQPAMRELIAHSVSVWESEAAALSYHPVGYLQISPEGMRDDVASIAAQQADIAYESVFVEGASDSRRYLRGIFDDWQGQGTTSVLHEKRGGYANNLRSLQGLAGMARAEGVSILQGVEVKGFRVESGAVTRVETSAGSIEVDQVVVAPGPWIRSFWEMLGLPAEVSVPMPSGKRRVRSMWRYLGLREGTLGVDPAIQTTVSGAPPPVVHFDTDAPLCSDVDGRLITDEMWGVYYKPDLHFGGIQGGMAPFEVGGDAADVQVDPYGPASPDFVVDETFVHAWCSALAHCQKRFEGKAPFYRSEPSGGLGAFTPDNFPLFDTFHENCYVIADSNHGYKMIGVGQLVARHLLGTPSALLEPFRFSRFAEGDLHPTSSSPFPWS